MSKKSPSLILLYFLVASLFSPANAATESLSELSAQLNIDPEAISVSGLSSGAFMALQFHVAHSVHVMGAGIIAGGPYRCAEGHYSGPWYDFSGLYTVMSVCTQTNPAKVFQRPPDVRVSLGETRKAAASHAIDNPENLRKSRIWMFSGKNDKTVPKPVMDTVRSYYSHFIPHDQIRFVLHPLAGHSISTDDSSNACEVTEPPYISNCGFDTASQLLQQIYGDLKPPVAKLNAAALHEFDQRPYFASSKSRLSMHEHGYLYVPESCAQGKRCRLHIALHGCNQSVEKIGDAFYRNGGYNEWAESNDVVMLYPQARAWKRWFWSWKGNPQGCWDWWGYSGGDYARKSGLQISTIARMVNELAGAELLEVPPR